VKKLREAGAASGMLCINRRLSYIFSAPLVVIGSNNPQLDQVPAKTPALALVAAYSEHVQKVDVSRQQIILEDTPSDQPPPRYSKVQRIRSELDDCRTDANEHDVAMLLIRLSRSDYWRDPRRRASYAELTDPAATDERLHDRIVLVGSTADKELQCPGEAKPRRLDIHNVVRGFKSTEVYGVELQADAIANLVTGRVITTPTVGAQAVIMVLLAAAGATVSFFTATMSRRRRWILAAAVVLYGAIAVVLASQYMLLNVLYDLAAFFVAYALLRRLQVRLVERSAP